ncbi:MAG: UbiA family prenyltransferase [Planctomycetota bacterium]
MRDPQDPDDRPDGRPTLRGHVEICRLDHWFKNVFLLPGVVAAMALEPATASPAVVPGLLVGGLSIGLVASSNYTLNEVLDAPHDRHHPSKRTRPVPAGRVSVPLAWVQWLALFAVGLGLGLLVSPGFAASVAGLWVMGCVYNVPPLRTKEIAYVDVITESVNNPIRMLAGWFIAGATIRPPASLLVSYWAFGCFFMAMKRYAEYRRIGDPVRARAYRRSFGYYDEARLLTSALTFAAAGALFFGAFLMRYRLELAFSFPLVAWVLGEYFALGLQPNSPVQAPEHLWRQRRLMLAVLLCAVTIGVLMFVDVPLLEDLFEKSRVG